MTFFGIYSDNVLISEKDASKYTQGHWHLDCIFDIPPFNLRKAGIRS